MYDLSGNHKYNLILGNDIFSELQIDLCFSDKTIRVNGGAYEGCTSPMKDFTTMMSSAHSHDYTFNYEELWERKNVLYTTWPTRCILDGNYEKSELRKVVSNNKKLIDDERYALHNLLSKYEFLFDGTLGTWTTKPINI